MPKFNQSTPEGRKGYYQANKEKIRSKQSAYGKKVRQECRQRIFEVLGARCKICGFDDLRALQIDHVNGGGVKEWRENNSVSLYRKMLAHIAAGGKDYQILCANHNWIKRAERGEKPSYKKS